MDDEPRPEIPNATYRALCTRGYADLTLQESATESDSKALIHYCYDTKGDLFDAFLDPLYEEYVDRIDSADDLYPSLAEHVDRSLTAADSDGSDGSDGSVEVPR